MPLNDQTRTQIRTYLQREIERYITEGLANPAVMETKPFHARLMPTLFGVPLTERSFSTRSGSWFQSIACMVASQFHQRASNNYRVTGNLQPAAETHIHALIRQMEQAGAARLLPQRERDIQQVLAVQFPGGVAQQVVSDLFVFTADGRELYFEMKTVAPNKDTSKLMKTKILLITALRQGFDVSARAAMAYNPAGEGHPYSEYSDSRYALQYLELNMDLIVGRPFWTMIGDDHTYDELLEIAEQVGRETAHLIPRTV